MTYADYSKTLHDNLDLVKDKFYKELLEKYCEFIDAFYTYTNNCLEKIKYTDNWEILKNEDFPPSAAMIYGRSLLCTNVPCN